MPVSVRTEGTEGTGSRLRPVQAVEQRVNRASAGGGRLAAVDGLRMLAAAAVAAYHYLGTPTPVSGARPTTSRRLHHFSTRSADTAGSASRRSF